MANRWAVWSMSDMHLILVKLNAIVIYFAGITLPIRILLSTSLSYIRLMSEFVYIYREERQTLQS